MSFFQDLINEPAAQYGLIGFGSLMVLCCCKNVIKTCYRRRRRLYINSRENMRQEAIEIINEIVVIDDDTPPPPPPSPSIAPVVEHTCQEKTSSRVRNLYINELIHEYINGRDIKMSINDVKSKYNYFRTPEDVRQLKTDLINTEPRRW